MLVTNAEIQVGEYVRTKNGVIRKAEEVLKGNYVNIDDGFFDTDYDDYRWGLEPDEIKAHSFNLIDLIEVGDYVNGDRVVNVINEEPCPSGKCVDIDSAKQSEDCTLWEEDIKTIVTKEQMEAMQYVV